MAAATESSYLWDLQPSRNLLPVYLRWRLWVLDNLVVSDAAYSALRFRRTGRSLREHDCDFLLVEIYAQGRARGEVGGSDLHQQTGCIHLIDMSRPVLKDNEETRTRGVLIPHVMVGYDPSDHPPVISLPCRSWVGRVLHNVVWSLPDRMPAIGERDAERVAREVAAVVRSLMLRTPQCADDEAVRRARRLAMESYIDASLADPNLGVETLCAAFGVSRASLYRYFPETSGVARYIRNRRLDAARSDLLRKAPARGVIGEVANRWGFTDTGHFHRVFKRQFAVNPSDVVETEGLLAAPICKQPAELLGGWRG